MQDTPHTHRLYLGRKPTNISVQADPTWPGMWRIHQAGDVSDMLNLARAKDAALSWVSPRGLAKQKPYWRYTETP